MKFFLYGTRVAISKSWLVLNSKKINFDFTRNKPRRMTMTKLMNLILDEEGATAIEYGLIAALIAAGIVGATTALGEQVVTTFGVIKDKMAEATTP